MAYFLCTQLPPGYGNGGDAQRWIEEAAEGTESYQALTSGITYNGLGEAVRLPYGTEGPFDSAKEAWSAAGE